MITHEGIKCSCRGGCSLRQGCLQLPTSDCAPHAAVTAYKSCSGLPPLTISRHLATSCTLRRIVREEVPRFGVVTFMILRGCGEGFDLQQCCVAEFAEV